MPKKTMHIGIDDTDSTRKGCTTYIAALLVEKLQKLNANFIDYPNLIRLNPNVPWKTRGNGAVCLRILHDESVGERIKETVISTVEEYSDLDFRGTDPGVVFFEKERIPTKVRVFARNSIISVVSLGDAMKLISEFKAEAVGFKNGRGIIGGLAAIGETLQHDHTFEILAYRVPENYGLRRKVDEDSIFRMDEETEPCTFNNIDVEKERVIITPRGPDPIFFGIRGETPEVVKKAFEIVKPLEPVERWVVFRTNQGTDAHLKRIKSLSEATPYSSIVAKGVVSAEPEMIRGRHVIFPIHDQSTRVDCAAYEPTGGLRKTAMRLMAGDSVKVYGGVRLPTEDTCLTINLEKLRLSRLAPKIAFHNPMCSKCGKRLKSMGKGQGFRCEKCGSKFPHLKKVKVRVRRDVKQGLYMTSTRSQRHLTKPFRRYGLEKRDGTVSKLIECWHFP